MTIDKSKLLILKSSDGRRFLGHRACIVNPCGDYCNPEDYLEGFVQEGGSEFIRHDEITEATPIKPFPIHYSNSRGGEYRELTEDSGVRLSLPDMLTEEGIEAMSESIKAQSIREWLLLNVECDGEVWVDPSGIRSEKEIRCQLPSSERPSYINFTNDNKR